MPDDERIIQYILGDQMVLSTRVAAGMVERRIAELMSQHGIPRTRFRVVDAPVELVSITPVDHKRD